MLLSWRHAAALVPIEYTGFVRAAVFGWLRFGEAVTVAAVAEDRADPTGGRVDLRRPPPLT